MTHLARFGFAGLVALGLLASNVALASVAAQPAQLIVEDGAQFFTPATIDEAKAIIAKSMGQGSRQVHVETFKSLSVEEQKALQGAADKKKFWHEWAISKTRGDRGISIFIVNDPPRYEVLVDRQMHNQGFDDAKENELKTLIKAHLEKSVKADTPDAKQAERDATLVSLATYLESTLPTTTKTAGAQAAAQKDAAKHDAKKEGSSIGNYVCIGVVVLLGVWLVVGLIRALKGGGGAGGAGGGGFGTALLGGLFGAMAGMWLYNSFFGGHDSSAFGGDSGGDYGGGEAGGAGDYGGDQGSGGDYGGGGDFGGGGDW